MIKFLMVSTILLSITFTGCGKCEHKYGNGIITKEATCIDEGETTYTCTLCDENKIESMVSNEHVYIEKITKEATYTEKGIKTYTCELCNDSYIEEMAMLDCHPSNCLMPLS